MTSVRVSNPTDRKGTLGGASGWKANVGLDTEFKDLIEELV